MSLAGNFIFHENSCMIESAPKDLVHRFKMEKEFVQ